MSCQGDIVSPDSDLKYNLNDCVFASPAESVDIESIVVGASWCMRTTPRDGLGKTGDRKDDWKEHKLLTCLLPRETAAVDEANAERPKLIFE